MIRSWPLTVGVALAVAVAVARAGPLTLTAADGVKVEAEIWRAAGVAPPIVLAFHQAEASHAEYAPIAPRLVAAGYTVLAIDQRSGGGQFGGHNRTVEQLGHSTDFLDALPDLEAALAWAKANGHGAPVIAMGSSYSAALVFLLAAKHPGGLAAIAAFSPGEYLGSPKRVREAARKVSVPVFVDQASDGEEIAASTAILAAVPGKRPRPFVSAAPSVHGAATLRSDQNPNGSEAQWKALLAFLAPLKGR